jgi:acid phosphatase family membrane protein YuiD
MDFSYAFTPFAAWLAAGSLKFCINSLKTKKLAFNLIGYGGLPSNHSAIVSSVTALIGFQEGIANPAFGVALGLAFIVILDATSLRKQVGKQAGAINQLTQSTESPTVLREKMGHTRLEIAAGVAVGVAVAKFAQRFLS